MRASTTAVVGEASFVAGEVDIEITVRCECDKICRIAAFVAVGSTWLLFTVQKARRKVRD